MRKRWNKGCFVKSIIKSYSIMRKKIKSGPTQIVLIVGHCGTMCAKTVEPWQPKKKGKERPEKDDERCVPENLHRVVLIGHCCDYVV